MWRKGYTVIELLSVLSMIAIMASLSVPSLQTMKTEAKITKAESEIRTLQTVIERYKDEYGVMPKDLDLGALSFFAIFEKGTGIFLIVSLTVYKVFLTSSSSS